MFKGLSVFFETYSITANDAKNDALKPIDVSCGVESSMVRVSDMLTRLGYGSKLENRDFKEIFAQNDNYEVTASFIALPNSGTRIGMAVFSPTGKLTKRTLISLMGEVAKEFEYEKQ